MAELRSLLAFMDPEDRARALRRYEQLFDRAGEAGEEELLARLGSPIRQVLEVEQEYRRAKKEGVLIYADELPVELSGSGETYAVRPEPPTSDLGRELRQAAAALDGSDLTAPAATEEEAAPEEDLFPIAALERADETPETDAPAEAPEGMSFSDEEPAAPAEASPEGPFSMGSPPEEPFSMESPSQEAPAASPASGDKDAAVVRELERIMKTAPEPAPGEDEAADEAGEDEEDEYEDEEEQGPGAGRVFGAVLVTVPLILLWAVGLAVFLALGVCSLAAGFVLCAAGVYLAGYALGGYIAFMPDLLLVCGGALGCFALALLFLWLGLWFIVGGVAALVRVTGRTYRRILRKQAGEDEDDE